MIKILQLSDTHLHADRNALLHGLSTQESLEQLLAKIKPKIESVDATILSGDVSQDRSAESYANIAKTTISGCTFWVFNDDGPFEYEYVYI